MHTKSLRELSALLQARELSARELTEYCLARSLKLQPRLNGYITITEDLALETADRVDALRRQGVDPGPLAGIPVVFKDNISTKGVLTTCASKALAHYLPPFSATVVHKLANCPLLGKANMDEFAMGSTNETSAYGPVCNPWDLQLVAGGSSGGSAALVAAGVAPFSLGSDTGGSVRQPAAFCGVTGFKPTYGRVSRNGLIALAPSLEQIGPLTRSLEDSALVLQTICGYDPRDSTSAAVKVPNFLATLNSGVAGLRLGLPREIFANCPDHSIAAAVEGAARELEKAGANLTWVSMPYEREALLAYILIGTAEASSSLARFDGVAFGYRGEGKTLEDMYTSSRVFGSEVRRRILLGTFGLSREKSSYDLGQRGRRLVAAHMNGLFREVDLLLLPTSPFTAFKLGAKKDALAGYYNDIYLLPANLAGLPAVSLPCGERDGLPIGLQLVAPKFREDLLFQAGYAWQSLSGWHQRLPREVG